MLEQAQLYGGNVGYILTLGVRKELRRQGLATLLLNTYLEHLRLDCTVKYNNYREQLIKHSNRSTAKKNYSNSKKRQKVNQCMPSTNLLTESGSKQDQNDDQINNKFLGNKSFINGGVISGHNLTTYSDCDTDVSHSSSISESLNNSCGVASGNISQDVTICVEEFSPNTSESSHCSCDTITHNSSCDYIMTVPSNCVVNSCTVPCPSAHTMPCSSTDTVANYECSHVLTVDSDDPVCRRRGSASQLSPPYFVEVSDVVILLIIWEI